jgi:predicted  nucleic acid-binding Zn-ribbon protein
MSKTETAERKHYKRLYEQLARDYDALEDETTTLRTTLVHLQQELTHTKEVINLQRELLEQWKLRATVACEIRSNPFLGEIHP